MSGIVGIARSRGTPVDPRVFTRLTATIRADGPDRQGEYCKGNAALGHSLLTTSERSEGERQPLTLDGSTWMIADVRLDDRDTLCQRLAQLDPAASSESPDAELLLRAWRAWGEDCLERLLGEFAFAIWNEDIQTLFCARDQFGVKPFYYARDRGDLLFSNSINALRAHPAVSDQLCHSAIADVLLFDCNRNPTATSFADIQKLPPAHSLRWTAGRISVRRYWRMPVDAELRYRDIDEYGEHFRDLLDKAVHDRVTTTRVSILMSGGLDSTAVAAVARLTGADCHAFVVTYEGLFPDSERGYAEQAARHLRLPVSFLDGAGHEPFEDRAHPGHHPPEVQYTPLFPVWIAHLDAAASFSRVALSGHGGDEILEQPGNQLLRLLRKGSLLEFSREYLSAWRVSSSLPRVPLLRALRHKLRPSKPWEPEFPRWLNPELTKLLGLRDRWHEYLVPPSSPHPCNPEAYRLLEEVIWPVTFEESAPAATRCQLEMRHPLLDLRLARFCLSLPLRPWMEGKGLMQLAMADALPEAVLRRPKTPLEGDPIQVAVERNPQILFGRKFHPAVHEFVDATRLPSGPTDLGDWKPMDDLRVWSLSEWLWQEDALRTERETGRHAA